MDTDDGLLGLKTNTVSSSIRPLEASDGTAEDQSEEMPGDDRVAARHSPRFLDSSTTAATIRPPEIPQGMSGGSEEEEECREAAFSDELASPHWPQRLLSVSDERSDALGESR